MSTTPEIRLARGDERGQILNFVEAMGFNPRDHVTWDGLEMFAMSAWHGGQLIGAIPLEPRPLRIAPQQTVWSAHETVVAVHPDHRNHGIGSAMQEALFTLLSGDAQFVSVFREDPETPAYRWYLKNGFRPAMRIDSWFFEQSRGDGIPPIDLYDPAEGRVPWDLIEEIWQTARQTGGGFVDRTERPLRSWLEVHPYRHRYQFTLAVERGRQGRPPGYALFGIGTMHSESPRLDILELLSTGDPDSTRWLLDAVLQTPRPKNCTTTRWPLATHDPNTQLARDAGFINKWSFDMLVRPLIADFDLSPEATAAWRYASIDYI
jgi:GNAT superfamily N-acetyltransferase